MAEAVFQDQVQKMGLSDFWEVESAAILNYHVGKTPEPRAVSTLIKEGITNYSHVARQVSRVLLFAVFLSSFYMRFLSLFPR